MWKKSERYDYFTQQTRLGRKKYVLHPGATCVEYSHTKISNINLPVKIPAAKHLRLTDCAFFCRRFLGWEDGGMHGVFSEHKHKVGVGREHKRTVCLDVAFFSFSVCRKWFCFRQTHPQKAGDRDSELISVKELSLMRFWEGSFLNSKMHLFLVVWNLN